MLEGFAVDAAGTLAEANAKLDGQAIALLDLNLPDGLGTELLRRIRSGHPHIGVVILTGAVDDLVVEALALTPDLLMRKPADVPALLEWLHGRGLRPPHPPQSDER